jgi:hypothetical protein
VSAQPQDPVAQALEQIMGGEIPGVGYLFAADPEARQASLIHTTPEIVRSQLLRAIEVCAIDAQLPYGQEKKDTISKAALAFAQAYLLLDPSVDQAGVPLGAEAEANAKVAQRFPPRVQPNPAEQAIAEKHKPQSEALRHTRGQTPRPQPRAGG